MGLDTACYIDVCLTWYSCCDGATLFSLLHYRDLDYPLHTTYLDIGIVLLLFVEKPLKSEGD